MGKLINRIPGSRQQAISKPCLVNLISKDTHLVYSYVMPVCSIVKTITTRCRGRPDALLREAEGREQ